MAFKGVQKSSAKERPKAELSGMMLRKFVAKNQFGQRVIAIKSNKTTVLSYFASSTRELFSDCEFVFRCGGGCVVAVDLAAAMIVTAAALVPPSFSMLTSAS